MACNSTDYQIFFKKCCQEPFDTAIKKHLLLAFLKNNYSRREENLHEKTY